MISEMVVFAIGLLAGFVIGVFVALPNKDKGLKQE